LSKKVRSVDGGRGRKARRAHDHSEPERDKVVVFPVLHLSKLCRDERRYQSANAWTREREAKRTISDATKRGRAKSNEPKAAWRYDIFEILGKER